MKAPAIARFDHLALHVANVEVSIRFYRDVLGLLVLPRPGFDFEGAWLLAGDRELHLIGNRTQKPLSGSRSNHFALQVNNLADWEAWFQLLKYAYRPTKSRPDGVKQIFLEDPDGHTIELCEKPT
jgi:catechol 2,3-dioxygenase-like lactoylglutathione lyase family enzyme